MRTVNKAALISRVVSSFTAQSNNLRTRFLLREIAQDKQRPVSRMDSCDEPILLRWSKDEKIKTRIHRKLAGVLLGTTVAVQTKVLSSAEDVHAFVESVIGVLPPEAQILVFDHVARQGGVVALLGLTSCCKWMHFLTRTYMHPTLLEEACRLACSNISLLPVSSATSYTHQFALEMRGSLTIRLVKKAFSMMALHCASPHCALSLREYNQAVLKDLSDPRQYPQLRNKATMAFYNKMETTGMIRVAFHKSDTLAPAHDVAVAFVSTNDIDNGDRIVRVDAEQSNTVWSPHSDMQASFLFNCTGQSGAFVRVRWMSASHDASALLYSVSEEWDDTGICNVKTYLWDMASRASYPVRFASVVSSSNGPGVEPSDHGWESLAGWFRKTVKGPADKDALNFAVVFQNEYWPEGQASPRYARQSIWQYKFDRNARELVSLRVCLEESEVLKPDDRLSCISSDVSGRWMGCVVVRGGSHCQSFGCLIDTDSDDEGIILCCPKALMGGRFLVRKVAVTPDGNKLAMTCSAPHKLCVEVHKRISDTAGIRLLHMPFEPDVSFGADNPSLNILTFSPCGRFLVWRMTEACRGDLQGLLSVAVSEYPVHHSDNVTISKLNTVRCNMPRDFCWRRCGVWLRLRRGAVLVQS